MRKVRVQGWGSWLAPQAQLLASQARLLSHSSRWPNAPVLDWVQHVLPDGPPWGRGHPGPQSRGHKKASKRHPWCRGALEDPLAVNARCRGPDRGNPVLNTLPASKGWGTPCGNTPGL